MNAHLNVVAILEALPGKEADLQAVLAGALPKFQAEPGCLAYTVLADKENAARFLTYEHWQDEAALQAHMATPTMEKAKAVLANVLAKPMQLIKLAALPGSTL